MPFFFYFSCNIAKVMEVFAEDFFIVLSAMTFGIFHYSCCGHTGIWLQIVRVFTVAIS